MANPSFLLLCRFHRAAFIFIGNMALADFLLVIVELTVVTIELNTRSREESFSQILTPSTVNDNIPNSEEVVKLDQLREKACRLLPIWIERYYIIKWLDLMSTTRFQSSTFRSSKKPEQLFRTEFLSKSSSILHRNAQILGEKSQFFRKNSSQILPKNSKFFAK